MKQFYVLDDGFLLRIPFEDRRVRYLGERNQKLPVTSGFYFFLIKTSAKIHLPCHLKSGAKMWLIINRNPDFDPEEHYLITPSVLFPWFEFSKHRSL